MTYAYVCKQHGEFEQFFKTIGIAEPYLDSFKCPTCEVTAERIVSPILGFALYGNPNGYNAPSTTKRHSTKVVDATTGNQYASG